MTLVNIQIVLQNELVNLLHWRRCVSEHLHLVNHHGLLDFINTESFIQSVVEKVESIVK